MNRKRIIPLAGVSALLALAGFIDLAYFHIGLDTGIKLSGNLIQFLIYYQGLILVFYYAILFIAVTPLHTEENSNSFQTWIILLVGLVIVFLVGALPFWARSIYQSLANWVRPFEFSILRVTFHYGAILTGLGLFRLGSSAIQMREQ